MSDLLCTLVIVVMWYNKLSCNVMVAAQAIHNFAPRLRGICSCIEFRDALCTCKLGAAKYGERVGSATNYSTLWSWTLWTCAFSAHRRKLLFTNLRGVVYAYKFIFEFDEWTKWRVCTWFRSTIWLVPPVQGGGTWQLFRLMLPGSLLPHVLRWEPGNEATACTGICACIWRRRIIEGLGTRLCIYYWYSEVHLVWNGFRLRHFNNHLQSVAHLIMFRRAAVDHRVWWSPEAARWLNG